jgi:hypothetical protein
MNDEGERGRFHKTEFTAITTIRHNLAQSGIAIRYYPALSGAIRVTIQRCPALSGPRYLASLSGAIRCYLAALSGAIWHHYLALSGAIRHYPASLSDGI